MTSAIIIGRANTVWDDLAAAETKFQHFDMVVAINGVGCDYPHRVDHWVSYHAELFPSWIDKRRDSGYPDAGQLWTSQRGRHITTFERMYKINLIDSEGGSSAMIALRVALLMGANRIILAGIPLDANAGHYDEPGNWDEAVQHRKAWTSLSLEVKGMIRSMSGWTREFFGAPTEEWFR